LSELAAGRFIQVVRLWVVVTGGVYATADPVGIDGGLSSPGFVILVGLDSPTSIGVPVGGRSSEPGLA
jgi:hypothetical protein